MLFTDVPIDATWDEIVDSYVDAMGWTRERAEEYVDMYAQFGLWKPSDRMGEYKDAGIPAEMELW